MMYFSVLTCIGLVPAYSIPGGYVQKFLVFLTHEEVLGVWSTRENDFFDECVGGPWGRCLGDFDL